MITAKACSRRRRSKKSWAYADRYTILDGMASRREMGFAPPQLSLCLRFQVVLLHDRIGLMFQSIYCVRYLSTCHRNSRQPLSNHTCICIQSCSCLAVDNPPSESVGNHSSSKQAHHGRALCGENACACSFVACSNWEDESSRKASSGSK